MIDMLIQSATLASGESVDIAITGSLITAIAPARTIQDDTHQVIDGRAFYAFPPFYNTHTHLAMTLLRGVDDSLPLMDWLNTCIWPIENSLTPAITYAGSRLAFLEMIKSGCVAFNDMYFYQDQTLHAAQEMGLRGRIGLLSMAGGMNRVRNDALLAEVPQQDGLIRLSYMPHAVYTTTPDLLKEIVSKSHDLGVPIHTHASESAAEVENCLKQYGMTPIALLEACGALSPTTILAHVCHPTDADIEILAKHQVTVAHCPCSNQKLASGTLPYAKLSQAGIRITVGTDGAASNDSLNMIAETKATALSAKAQAATPTAINIHSLYRQVTREAAVALGFDNAGELKVGRDADLILVSRRAIPFVTGGDVISNLIYAATPEVVDTVICAGRILMQDRRVPHEDEILDQAQAVAQAIRP